MLPGKKYKPEDVLKILRRRIWFLLVPFAVVSAGTAVVARRLPDWYQSETLVLVVPQKVPEAYVRSTVTTRIEDRLQSISQTILSRTRLERIIDEFGLYAQERRSGIMEDVVQTMRNHHINVTIRRGDAFAVTFIGREPRTVMRVTDKLASLFIDESLRDREILAQGTNQFLEGTLEDARRQLMEKEDQLRKYRELHRGELPDEVQANQQGLGSAQLQLQGLSQALTYDQQQRLQYIKALNELESPSDQTVIAPEPAAGGGVTVGPDGRPQGGTATARLTFAKAMQSAMEAQKFGPNHPEMKTIKKIIEGLQKQADAEALEQPVSRAAPVSPAEQNRRRALDRLRAELEQLDTFIAYKKSEEKRLQGVVALYQRRLEAAPTREAEMSELMRDYSTMQGMYTSMLGKREESRIAANLESRQIGEQFKILDGASLPQRPFSPNRRQINMLGMVAGLGLGIALIALLEYRDSSFKTDEEVSSVLTLPVLAVVPFMQSDRDRKKAFRRRFVIGFGLGSTVVACLAVVVYTFVR
jgi:polysaccharide chain length determinant protein (PEP-CTERM system associated)